MDAAAEVLRERTDASMDDIARAAGVSRQTVYAHFSSRDALRAAVLERATAETAAAIDVTKLGDLPPREALVRVLDAGWRIAARYPVLWHLPPVSEEEDASRHAPLMGLLADIIGQAAVVTAVVLAAGSIAVLGSVLASQSLLSANGFSPGGGFLPLTLVHGPALRAAAGSVLYFWLIAMLGLGTATAVRESGVATTLVLGLLYVLPTFGSLILNPHWERRLQRYSPMDAGLAIQATRNLGKLPIGPWEGLGVLACWAAVAMLAGWGLLRWRDA